MVWACAALAQTDNNNFTFTVNQLVPDANVNGLTFTTDLSLPDANSIQNITVGLNISGGYNGDLFAFLAGPNGGYAVLLNRVGVGNSSSFGYGDQGFNIVLSDAAANDVHYYQSDGYSLNGSQQLTGTWAPDGRNIDPQSAPSLFASTSPTAMLGSFLGKDPNGLWTLFVADLSNGAQSQLVSWSLDIITVPEPSVCLIGILGLGLLAGMGKISRHKK